MSSETAVAVDEEEEERVDAEEQILGEVESISNGEAGASDGT